uniref:Uncharacterized protein n=1 Tax=Nelumbo nucifera TaxID=4432 RepID=A0A822ZNI3_NELNU|nr:TPA_asm: hypothetical protein HUJ06_003321 [Nelumbo nucifera]
MEGSMQWLNLGSGKQGPYVAFISCCVLSMFGRSCSLWTDLQLTRIDSTSVFPSTAGLNILGIP